jgi:excisionase family DNA binding protein
MSRRWVVELVRKGEIEGIKPGARKFLVSVESLRKYLEKKGLKDLADSLDQKILEIRSKK